MQTFGFFWLQFRRAYDCAYDSELRFSLGHKVSYDSDYYSDSDSVASENQPWKFRRLTEITTIEDGGWGESTPYNGLYREVPPERGTFLRLQVYKRVGISQVEVYKRLGKSVI